MLKERLAYLLGEHCLFVVLKASPIWAEQCWWIYPEVQSGYWGRGLPLLLSRLKSLLPGQAEFIASYLCSLWIPMLRIRQQCSSQYSCGLGLVSQCGLLVNNGRPSAWTAAPALGVYPLMLPCPKGAVATKQCCYHVPQNRGKRRHWELLPSGLRPSGNNSQCLLFPLFWGTW